MENDALPFEEFIEETTELLDDLEALILKWETSRDDPETIDALFRGMHTVKGGAGIVKESRLADYAHELENLLDQARAGKVLYSEKLGSVLLQSLDCIRRYLSSVGNGAQPDLICIEENLNEIQPLLQASPSLSNNVDAARVIRQTSSVAETQVTPTPYLITLKFDPETFRKGRDPLLLLQQISELGECVPVVHQDRLPDYAEFDPQTLYLWWTLKLVTTAQPSEINELLQFFRSGNQLSVVPFEETPDETESVARAHEEQLSRAITDGLGLKPGPAKLDHDDERGSKENENTESSEASSATKSIRVSLDRLEKIQNLIGETVINQSRLSQLCMHAEQLDPEFAAALNAFYEENARAVQYMQDEMQAVRMVQVGTVFSRLRRLVRDYSVKSKKEIRLVIEGGETELDKTVTDRLHGPLLHLIRNAMDHGLENPEDRRNVGKDPKGSITLRASHKGGHVIVEVEDDGRGFDLRKIQEKALDLGLVDAKDDLSTQQLLQLVFHPGFTTTDAVTEVSGRGVGMDTVKRDIEALLGTIDIFSTQGKGTKLRLNLPLTLAIIDGMIVRVGLLNFVLPLVSVIEAVRPTVSDLRKVKNEGEVVEIRGEFLPLVRLHEKFMVDCDYKSPADAVVLVIHQGERKQCLMVDEIVDQRPVVIKNLDENFVQVPGMSGATIMGDGKVSFILDVATVMN